jgi:hypothetical protein
MKIKIFCRCSLFLPGRAKDLSAPLYSYRNMLIRTDTHVSLLTSLDELLAVNTVDRVAFFR